MNSSAFFPERTSSRHPSGTPILFPGGSAAFPFSAPIPPGAVRILRSAEPQNDGRLLVVLADGATGFLPADPGTSYLIPGPGDLAGAKVGSRLLVLKDKGGFSARFAPGQEVFVYRIYQKTNVACKLAGEKDLPHPQDRKDWLILATDVVMLLPDAPAPEPEKT